MPHNLGFNLTRARLCLMKTLYLLDAVSLLFRSYYAIRRMTNQQGQSTNALYGFIRSVQKIIKDFSPTHLAAIFDGPNNKQARQKIYQQYKGHREGMPDDLIPQLGLAVDYCTYAGIPQLVEPGVEADDMIGSIAKWAEARQIKTFICSSDKDLCQLVSDTVKIIHTHKDNLIVDKSEVEKMHQVKPEQIVDYLALMGDKSDNIPGVPGIGPKTAAALLNQYPTLDELFNHLGDLKNKRWAEKLATHRKEAFISQQLAQLMLDLSFPKDDAFFALTTPNDEQLTALYREMNFASLLKDLAQKEQLSFQSAQPAIDQLETVDYQTIDELSELSELISRLEKEPEICLDTETTATTPMQAELVGIGLGVRPGQAWYLPANGKLGLTAIIAALKPLLESPTIQFYGHNLKYDIHILLNYGIKLQAIGFDTILASYVLNPHVNRHSLDALVLERFGKAKTPIKELIGTGKKQQSMRTVPIAQVAAYCCEDVDYTCRLKTLFQTQLKQESLTAIFYDIELPLIPVLVAMERFGMYLDAPKLKEMARSLEAAIHQVEEKIYQLAGETFNIKSPKQLSQILFEKLKIKTGNKKQSTRAEILESLMGKHPIAAEVLSFRFLEKLRSTYVQTLPLQVNPNTERIHCSFKQFVTATGRLSCQDPNLQNIPFHSAEGKKIRAAFRPKNPDWCYLAADYSQIELRLLAHLSDDERLIAAFASGEDIHATTAAAIFNCPLNVVTKEQRFQAKAVNFGIIYGQQAFGLSKQLGISMKEAASFIETYFNRYPKVKQFLEECKEKARQNGFAITMTGRKRPIPEIYSPNAMIRQAAERLAVNTPLQGSQADIIKKAMIDIHRTLIENKQPAHMVLQIHDELIFELPKPNTDKVKKIVRHLMETAVQLKIPLTVNIAIGKNWGEC
ncbi:MAG: DNA polymerase I [Chlamydiota bacterium]